MEKDFRDSLTAEQLQIVNAAIELYSDYVDGKRAEKTLAKWIANGKPSGITMEELNKKLEKKANATRRLKIFKESKRIIKCK